MPNTFAVAQLRAAAACVEKTITDPPQLFTFRIGRTGGMPMVVTVNRSSFVQLMEMLADQMEKEG